jgi:hypothetical protein
MFVRDSIRVFAKVRAPRFLEFRALLALGGVVLTVSRCHGKVAIQKQLCPLGLVGSQVSDDLAKQ